MLPCSGSGRSASETRPQVHAPCPDKRTPRAHDGLTIGVGRPRDERIDAEVAFAVLSALKEGGYGAVTIDGIARRVGRARTSIYRRWTSKRSLVAYAVLSEMGDDPAADTGSVRGDLEAAVGTLLKAFAGPLGRALAGLVADMAQDKALAVTIRKQVLTARRKSMREALVRARNRGEVREWARRGTGARHAHRPILLPHPLWTRADHAKYNPSGRGLCLADH